MTDFIDEKCSIFKILHVIEISLDLYNLHFDYDINHKNYKRFKCLNLK